MFHWRYALVLVLVPGVVTAQQPVAHDSLHQHGDTLPHPARLQEVTVMAAPARREEASSAVTIPSGVLQQTHATDPYDLLRQTAGIEVHDQGQGPGFASDASV